MSTRPDVGSTSRLTILRAVVFPPPDGPTSTHASPAGTLRDRLSSAGGPVPYRLVASWYSSIGRSAYSGASPASPLYMPLDNGQCTVDGEGQGGDDRRGGENLGLVAGAQAGEDRITESTRGHERRDGGHAHGGHGGHPHAADHHWQRQR